MRQLQWSFGMESRKQTTLSNSASCLEVSQRMLSLWLMEKSKRLCGWQSGVEQPCEGKRHMLLLTLFEVLFGMEQWFGGFGCHIFGGALMTRDVGRGEVGVGAGSLWG